VSRDVFPAVEPASTVFAPLQTLREAILADPGLAPDGVARVRAELRLRPDPTDGAQIARFYWSLQRTDPGAPLGFTARTLYDGRRIDDDRRLAVPTAHDFPDEPVLTWLADSDGPLNGPSEGTRVKVLRYIPLRRVTFCADDAAGLPARVIAKTQTRSSLLQATRILLAVRRAVALGGIDSFAIPRPVRLDARRRLLYLEELPGTALSRIFDQTGADEAMSRLGAMHRTLHELDVDVGRTRDPSDWLRETQTATASIAILLPSLRRRMTELYDELVRTVPEQDGRAFCQGDFVPSQILCDPSGWSVLDFDDAHHGDPWAEVAALYVALPRELSLKDDQRAEAARGAYLRGYIEAAGQAPDAATWRWHVLVAQLSYFALRLTKGRAVPGQAELLLDGIDSGSLRLPA
jgi:aminoglycoside phosphotransferase